MSKVILLIYLIEYLQKRKTRIIILDKDFFKPNLELSCESVDTRDNWLIHELLNEFDNDDIGGDIVNRRTVVWINLARKFAHAPRNGGSPWSRNDKRYVITWKEMVKFYIFILLK
jgi:hypothetical protein